MDTLTRMRAFIAVVEAEGFSAAARKIGRSKALLSKYVRELEDDLGALLLNRTTRQFSLTEAGHTYFRRASEIIREIDSLADSVRESSGDVKGRIKLSAPRTFADAPIGQSLIDFAAAHPAIVLDINLDDRFVDLVEEGFDLAIRISRLENSSLIARRLAPFSVTNVVEIEVSAPLDAIEIGAQEAGVNLGAVLCSTTGTLSPMQRIAALPDGFTGQNTGSQIYVHPSGRTLYMSNRGHDSIACFVIDLDEEGGARGSLRLLGWQPTVAVPRAFGLDPAGRFLYVSGQRDGDLAAYRIDGEMGELSHLWTRPVGDVPAWVLLLAL